MRIKCSLSMYGAIVEGQFFDVITISWEENLSETGILRISQKWLSTSNFLLKTMTGLESVGESDLIIEPF